MEIDGKTVIVTGAAQGIGAAIAERFSRAGAHLVLGDLNERALQKKATAINALAVKCDVRVEEDIRNLVSVTEEAHGQVDMFISNAGVCFGEGEHSASAGNDVWQTSWEIHVMSHVYAARAVLPSMIERGQGYLVQMASAAGLLSQIGDAAYSATKHAAIGFAESIAITHGDDGIGVSAVCPQYVATGMTGYSEGAKTGVSDAILLPEQVAEIVLTGVEAEEFLILPHPEVLQYIKNKSEDYSRWLGAMRKLRRKIISEAGSTRLEDMHKLM